MNTPFIFRIAVLIISISLPAGVGADEWSDAGFTALHRVVWLDAGFSLREAKRWKSRCGITDPTKVAEWVNIGLTTPTSVSIWMQKGFDSPESVVKYRNGESVELAEPNSQLETKENSISSGASSDRKRREWLKKSQIEELIASGVEPERAEEWIYAGYSSDETMSWLKIDTIQYPDDLSAWLDIDVDSPEALLEWYAQGLITPAAVQKQMVFEKGERDKFARMGIFPEMEEEWEKIGARTFNQVNYLIKNGYNIEKLRQWMSAGFATFKDIDAWRESGLSATEAKRWRDAGFNSGEVVALLASKFSLAEIVEWQALFGPYAGSIEQINSWRSAGFNPTSAGTWIRKHPGISAEIAEVWNASGYMPGNEWVLLETTPDVIEQWRNSKFSPLEVIAWIRGGFDEPAAQQWSSSGLNARHAKMWRDQNYSPITAEMWVGQGVEDPHRATRLKEITTDVSNHFVKGVTYNSFRKTAKLLDIHKLPSKLGVNMPSPVSAAASFDTLTPFAKCMTAYANKKTLSESAVADIELAHFYQREMKQADAKRFMQRHRNSCEDWTRYIFTIWRNSLN